MVVEPAGNAITTPYDLIDALFEHDAVGGAALTRPLSGDVRLRPALIGAIFKAKTCRVVTGILIGFLADRADVIGEGVCEGLIRAIGRTGRTDFAR